MSLNILESTKQMVHGVCLYGFRGSAHPEIVGVGVDPESALKQLKAFYLEEVDDAFFPTIFPTPRDTAVPLPGASRAMPPPPPSPRCHIDYKNLVPIKSRLMPHRVLHWTDIVEAGDIQEWSLGLDNFVSRHQIGRRVCDGACVESGPQYTRTWQIIRPVS